MSATNPREKNANHPPITVPINAACSILGIGRTKIYELIADKRIKTILLGKRRLVVYSSLEALVEG